MSARVYLDLEILVDAIEHVDGGCYTCVLGFVQRIKEATEKEDFERVIARLEKSDRWWADQIRKDLK